MAMEEERGRTIAGKNAKTNNVHCDVDDFLNYAIFIEPEWKLTIDSTIQDVTRNHVRYQVLSLQFPSKPAYK